MNLNSYSLSEVKEAYLKLKSYVYYDTSNTNLFLRENLARFEKEEIFENEGIVFNNIIELLNNKKQDSFLDSIMKKIDYCVLPKRFYELSQNPKDKVLSNITTAKNYSCEKLSVFINLPIELHIISVLWVMRIGIELDNELHDTCYGNRLQVDKKKQILKKGNDLFLPYQFQYQKWRDEGVNKALFFLNKGEDVLFVNLDIRNYYYSVAFNFEDYENKHKNIVRRNYFLNNIIKEILKNYKIYLSSNWSSFQKDNFSKNTFPLPIGFIPSNILSNWYLLEFDYLVKHKLKPIHYSRYVDDISLVILNPKINVTSEDSETPDQASLINDNLNSILQYDSLDTWKLKSHSNLKIQNDKILFYHFNSDYSNAVIEKLKKDLLERSSEFRYPDPEESDNLDFDKMAHELIYNDSVFKISTLKDYKINRYGLSTYLSKKISQNLLVEKHDNNEEIDKVIKLFQGRILVEHYRLWEKLFTLALVVESKKHFFILLTNIVSAIDKIKNDRSKTGYNLSDNKVISELYHYLIISLALALSLNPSFYSEDELFYYLKRATLQKLDDLEEVKILAYLFRDTNMLRHFFVIPPLINYSTLKKRKKSVSYIDKKFAINYIDKYFNQQKTIDTDSFLQQYSPRKTKLYEHIIREIDHKIMFTSASYKVSRKTKVNQLNIRDFLTPKSILDNAFQEYFKFNYPSRTNHLNAIKESLFKISPIDKCHTDSEISEIWINSTKEELSKPRFSIANLKVLEKDVIENLKGNPTLNSIRQETIKKLFYMAKNDSADFLLLPEFSFPWLYLEEFAKYSAKLEKVVVAGFEHRISNKIAFNFIVTIFPIKIFGKKDSIIIARLKNFYAPSESELLNKYHLVVPKPDPEEYHLFHWRNLYFPIYYCFEIANIQHRGLFKSMADFVIASEWNKDVNYFSNIIESTSRDLHTYFIQVNTSQFGDSRITQPKKSERKDILKIKGGDKPIVITDHIDVSSLREFQLQNLTHSSEDDFKIKPPSFDVNNVRKRIEDKSFGSN